MIDQILIDYKLCIKNKYLAAYVKLLEANAKTEKQKNKTQQHHAIPVCYYMQKYNCTTHAAAKKYADSDPNNFLVNLLYKDHLLAHYYLMLAAAADWFKWKNGNTLFLCLHFIPDNEQQLILQLDHIQEMYEAAKTARKHFKHSITPENRKKMQAGMTADSRARISKARSDCTAINKDEVTKLVKLEDLDSYLRDGWSLGTGKIHVFKDRSQKNIWPSELPNYLADGWQQGNVKKLKKHIKLIDADGNPKYISYNTDDELQIFLSAGYKLATEETKKKYAATKKQRRQQYYLEHREESIAKCIIYNRAHKAKRRAYYVKARDKKLKPGQKVKPWKKSVKCIELQQIFVSIMEAERQLGIDHHDIGLAIKTPDQTAGGYHWVVIDTADNKSSNKVELNNVMADGNDNSEVK